MYISKYLKKPAAIFLIVLFIFNMSIRLNIKAVFLVWLLSLAIFIGISTYAVGGLNKIKILEFGEQMEARGILGKTYKFKYKRNQFGGPVNPELNTKELPDSTIKAPTNMLSL